MTCYATVLCELAVLPALWGATYWAWTNLPASNECCVAAWSEVS